MKMLAYIGLYTMFVVFVVLMLLIIDEWAFFGSKGLAIAISITYGQEVHGRLLNKIKSSNL